MIALQELLDWTVRWLLFPLLKFGVVLVAALFLLLLLTR